MIKIFLLLIFILPSLTYSQQEPIVTDRPDITESAVTVPLNSFQVETGFIVQNSREEADNVTVNIKDVSLLTTLLRYGLLEGLELRLGTEYLYQKVDLEGRSNSEGFNGLLVGTKIQLTRDNISLPDAALLVHLNIPFGSEDFKADNIEPEIILTLSHNLIETFSLSYNLGGVLSSSEEMLYLYSISLGRPLSEKMGAFIEFFGETARGLEFGKNIDCGLTYLLQDNFQADISAGINLNQPENNWFLSTGVSFRLPE